MSDRNKNGAGKGDLSRRVKRKNWDKGWEMAFGKGKAAKREALLEEMESILKKPEISDEDKLRLKSIREELPDEPFVFDDKNPAIRDLIRRVEKKMKEKSCSYCGKSEESHSEKLCSTY